jgi:hypothetical protein
MDGRIDEFLDALTMMSAALRLLQEGECPFDVAAHLDFATHRLGDHLAASDLALSDLMEVRQPNWIN